MIIEGVKKGAAIGLGILTGLVVVDLGVRLYETGESVATNVKTKFKKARAKKAAEKQEAEAEARI